MEDTDTFPSLLAALTDYQSSSDRLSPLDDFMVHFEPQRKALRSLPERKGVQFRKTAERFASVLERFMFVALVCRRKIDAINLLIRSSVGTKNAIALAQGTRSLLEHVAVEAQIVVNLEQLASTLKGQTDGSKIHDALEKSEAFLKRCYFGRSPKVEPDKAKQALHINDCIKSLETETHGASAAYDFLCEFVHPNHGSNILVSTSELNVQILSIVADFRRHEVQRIGSITLTMLRSCQDLESKAFASIAFLGGHAQRFRQEGAKLSNVFSVRKLRPVGDGKSQATAYHFPTARDQQENFELWFEYLDSRRIKVFHREQVTVKEGSIYDIYQTTQGALWHRVDYLSFENAKSGDGQFPQAPSDR